MCSLARLSLGFSRQAYWSGLPGPPPPGDIPNPGIKPGSPALQADSLLSEPPRKPPSCFSAVLKKSPKLIIIATTTHNAMTSVGL